MFFAVGIAWLPIIPGVVINMRHPERACIQELRSSKTVVDNINPYYEWTLENEQQIREGGYMFVYCWNLFYIIFSTCWIVSKYRISYNGLSRKSSGQGDDALYRYLLNLSTNSLYNMNNLAACNCIVCVKMVHNCNRAIAEWWQLACLREVTVIDIGVWTNVRHSGFSLWQNSL